MFATVLFDSGKVSTKILAIFILLDLHTTWYYMSVTENVVKRLKVYSRNVTLKYSSLYIKMLLFGNIICLIQPESWANECNRCSKKIHFPVKQTHQGKCCSIHPHDTELSLKLYNCTKSCPSYLPLGNASFHTNEVQHKV